MNDNEKNCYMFILNLAKELVQEYDVQYQHMEEFARWNLPEEIALEWIDAVENAFPRKQLMCYGK